VDKEKWEDQNKGGGRMKLMETHGKLE